MSDKFDETSVDTKGSKADGTGSPDCSGTSGDECRGTASDSNPSADFKSPLILSSREAITKPKGYSAAELRLTQDFESRAGVKKVLTQIHVDKPAKHVFFRVHTGDEWCVEVWILEFKEDREIYLIHPNTREFVGDLAVPTILYTAITRNGDIFFLPVKLSRSDGRSDSWNESRRSAAELSKSKWIRIAANMNVGAYDVYEALGNIPDPDWSMEETFEDLLNIAFRDRIIEGYDHPVLRKLRGEI